MGQSLLAIIFVIVITYAINSSVRVVSGEDEALVERLGRYHRTLKPGLNFIIPLLDKIVYVDTTTRERVLDVEPQQAITKDNVALMVDAVVYWRIFNLQKAYYGIDNVERAIASLVLTTFRAEIGQIEMQQIFSARDNIKSALLRKLDEATTNWGVKVIRVEIKSITPPKTVQAAMETERAAQSEKLAMIRKAQGTTESMKLLLDVLKTHPNGQEVLRFLVAEKYVEATHRLGESDNAKILFMDPKAMSDALNGLIDSQSPPSNGHNFNGSNGESPE